AGSADLKVTITGSDFLEGTILSQAVWSVNGGAVPLATTFVSSTQITAVIPAALLTNPVDAKVFVRNWDHIEDVTHSTSGPAIFIVASSASKSPLIASISPTSAVAGSPDLMLTITGSNLVPTLGHE